MLEQLTKRLAHYRPWRLRGEGPEAGVLVALTDQPEPEVVLTLRSQRLSTHGGEVAFPGGKRDPGDVDLRATALREAHEEVGLAPGQVRVIGSLGQLLSKHRLRVTPWVGIISADQVLRPNPAEIERIFRIPLGFFLEEKPLRTDEIAVLGRTHYVPAWRYQDTIIWGLTAHVLVELLNMGLDANLPMRRRPEHEELEHD